MSKVSIGASGYVVARRFDKNKNLVQELRFSNHVLDVGMDYLIEKHMTTIGAGILAYDFRYLFLGTGTTEPSHTDTGLESRSGTLDGQMADDIYPVQEDESFETGRVVDAENQFFQTSRRYNFKYGMGVAEGVWTELGLAGDTSYTNPMTRALFRDETGAPTSLTILSDEYLEVDYTVVFRSGVDGPKPGQFTIGDQTIDYKIYGFPGSPAAPSGWNANFDYSPPQWAGLWAYQFPFGKVRAFQTVYTAPLYDETTYNSEIGTGLIGPDLDSPDYTRTYDPATRTVSHQFTIGPTSADESIAALASGANATGYPEYDDAGLYVIHFDTPFIKKADYRVTFNVDVQFVIQIDPIAGLSLDASTATSLDFSWDKYLDTAGAHDASEYHVKLRSAGVVAQESTIDSPAGDPDAAISFTGLDPDTEYLLEVSAVTTAGRSTVREYLYATTEAA